MKHAVPSVLQVPGTAGHWPLLRQGRALLLHCPATGQSPLTKQPDPVAEQWPCVFGQAASLVHATCELVHWPIGAHSAALVHTLCVVLHVPASNGQSAFEVQALCTVLHCPRFAQSPATRHAVWLIEQVPCRGAQSAVTLHRLWLTLHCFVPGQSPLDVQDTPVTLQFPGGQT